MTRRKVKGPGARPCVSCPYRRDVPSGVWSAEEYAKLPGYDQETGEQPPGVFLCHQQDGRVCAGWAGCHDGTQLLSLRFAQLMPDGFVEGLADMVIDYVSPVPLFDTGAQAAEHGLRDLDEPGPEAVALMDKVTRQLIRRREAGESL